MHHYTFSKKLIKLFKVALLLFLSFQVISVVSTQSVLPISVSADVGNSFSGGSGGGSDYSGGSSNNYSYSSGSSSGSSGRLSIFDLGIAIIVIIIFVVLKNILPSNDSNSRGTYSNPGYSSNSGFNENGVVEQIKKIDQEFSKEEMISYANEVWLTLQEAWESKEWQKVRPFESNTLFTVHSRQLQEFIDNNMTNYMNKQNIRSTKLARFSQDETFDVLDIKLDASLLDYTLNDETGELIEGSKTTYVHRSYHLQFIRKKGNVTTHDKSTNVTNCPNCGAPTEITSSGQCEYCGSVITNGDYGWVLNKYEPWNEFR